MFLEEFKIFRNGNYLAGKGLCCAHMAMGKGISRWFRFRKNRESPQLVIQLPQTENSSSERFGSQENRTLNITAKEDFAEKTYQKMGGKSRMHEFFRLPKF